MSEHERIFATEYTKRLRAAIERNPDNYAYPASEVPACVERMIPALRRGGAHVSPQIRATGKALGIGTTTRAIRDYLNA